MKTLFLHLSAIILFVSGSSFVADHKAKQNINTTNSAYPSELGPAPGYYQVEGLNEIVSIPFEFFGMNLMIEAAANDKPVKMLIDNRVLWDELAKEAKF